VHGCCRNLRASCRTPFSGVTCAAVEAFCREDQASTELLAWAQHKLRHEGSTCRAYKGVPFDFVPDAQRSSKAAAPAATVVEETAELIAEARSASAPAAAAPAGAGMIAAACAGGALVGAALVGIASTLRAAMRDARSAAAPAEGVEPLLADEAQAVQPVARRAPTTGTHGDSAWR
jgi:hypothetical protein